jgi:hypothetical protein
VKRPVVRRHLVRVAAAEIPGAVKQEKTKRFRRTKEEIERGLTREQAMAKRGGYQERQTSNVPRFEPQPASEGKRFRRTAQEIEMGLTKEQAMEMRQRYAAPKKVVERIVAPKVEQTVVEQLEATLSPKVQARARAVHRYRAAGGKAILAPDTLDQIEQFIAAGKVTKCPPCTDSDGYDHLNQKEVA